MGELSCLCSSLYISVVSDDMTTQVIYTVGNSFYSFSPMFGSFFSSLLFFLLSSGLLVYQMIDIDGR